MEKQNRNHNRRQRRLVAAALSGNLLVGGLLATSSAAVTSPPEKTQATHVVSPRPFHFEVHPPPKPPKIVEHTTKPHAPEHVHHTQHQHHEPVTKPAPEHHVHHHTAARISSSLEVWLKVLRNCESSGNYHDDTGNGYYGAYQFSRETWDNQQTGYALASEAPPDVQDRAIIHNTLESSGGLATQNPGCYEKEHLSQFPPQ